MLSQLKRIRFWWIATTFVLAATFTAYAAYLTRGPEPKYDLLFAVDYNDRPYEEPTLHGGTGVRATDHKAELARPSMNKQEVVPHLYVCAAATGKVSRVDIEALSNLKIDASTTAPNGYSLSRKLFGFISFEREELERGKPRPYLPFRQMFESISFAKAYSVLDLVDRGLYVDRLKDDNYAHCLNGFASSTNPIVHFVGWIVRHPNSS